MGRRKGSKNKPKEVNNAISVREISLSNIRADDNVGVSILDLSETVRTRDIPILKYNSESSRTKGVEKRILSLVSKHKNFHLNTDVLIEYDMYFIDSGGWAFAQIDGKYDILISHVRNLLPFLGGPYPIGEQKRSYTRRTVRRGTRLG
jgi:hypothetical protein|tara:strand:+ start:1306 stop:1749 length:444 start_codon:yes stop_codon:yes gene_type:complete